ncbi:MAG: hypothetical protein KDA24_15895 [Deltaproteobacteria bacterium]|nr:hypothetical protein [Deltaproteobacteria bacterium]
MGAAGALCPSPIHAQEIDPAAEEAFFSGVALLEAGDPAGAIAKFDQALRIDKNLRRVHFYRARAWARLGDIEEARADITAYDAFPLNDVERKQLALLRTEVDERAEQIGTAEPRPDRPVRPQEDEATTGPDGFTLLRQAEEELARGACDKAEQGAQDALSADNTLTRAFLIKGLALECLGEADRALTVIGMYEELRAGQPADPVATAARTRIEKVVRGESAAPAEPLGPSWSVRGDDPRIEGIMGQQFGLPMAQAVEVRTRRRWVAGVGPADVGRPRMSVGGSTARVERAWLGDRDGLQWTRLRVYERSGIETTAWFVRSFGELYREVERTAGPPNSSKGMKGQPEDPEGAKAALKGTRHIEVRWTDEDGDVVALRLGRCTVSGDVSPVHPDNAPCLELVAWSGSWSKPTDTNEATKAARRIERPGRLQVDLSGGLGLGMAPTVWALNYRTNSVGAIGGEIGLDVNVRVAFGAFVAGMGYSLSLAGYTAGTTVGPFAENRVMAYVGLRDRPRQRTMTDIMLGFGLVPEAFGTAPAISFRVLSQVRTAPIGRFYVSFEPYVVVGTDLTIVPIRFAIGGLFGTKQRPVRSP